MQHGVNHFLEVADATYAKFNQCVHCGLCLPACPTYVITTNEADSPRGRIHLMKAAVDERVEVVPLVLQHLDACLVCRACEVACPSGVVYHDLIEAVRPQVAQQVRGRPMVSPLLQWMIANVLPYPRRMAAAVLPLRVAQKLGLGGVVRKLAGMLPGPTGALAATLPPGPVWPRSLPAMTPAVGQRRGSVLLMQGCVGSVLSFDVNAASVLAMSRNGFEVHTLGRGEEPCCGAMAAHGNDPEAARQFAAAVVDLLSERDEDFFVSPIAGCGAQLKELYEVLGEVPEYCERAEAVVRKVRDVTELLATGLVPPKGRIEATVAYHDPCHLLNVQKVSEPPRQILRQIPGLRLVALPENDLCCGAAGAYNLSHPGMASALGARKVQNILATRASIVATANVGCQMQMQRELEAAGAKIPVKHVVELLAASYAAE